MNAAAGLTRDDLERLWPGLYERFCEIVATVRARGMPRFSQDAVCHLLRAGMYEGGHPMEVNDHATSACARVWMAEHGHSPPGFLELRQSRWDPPGDERQPGLFDGETAR